MSYQTQRDALVRTRQELLVVGVRECENFYAAQIPQLLQWTDDFTNGVWTNSLASVAANAIQAPDKSLTADSLGFAGAGSAISQDAGVVVTSKAFTASLWMKSPLAMPTENVTLRIRNAAGTEIGSINVFPDNVWRRYFVEKLFSATPVDHLVFEIIRTGGDDISNLYVWRANVSQNPGARDRTIPFPSMQRLDTSTPANSCSRCAATDQGDGARCFYSRPTCQDPDHFNAGNAYETDPRGKGIREFRFCRQNAPLPLPTEDVMPLLISSPTAAQEIVPDRAVTVNERLTFEFEDDAAPGVWNLRQAGEGALVNTARGVGTFWRRWATIYRNYANPEGYVSRKVGFVEAGMTEADFEPRGKYLIADYQASDRKISLVCVNRMKLATKLPTSSQVSIPAKISTTNKTGKVALADTTIRVDDASEISVPGAGYTVTLELEPGTGNSEKVNVTAVDILNNRLTVARGRWGTTAIAHAAKSVFREIIEFGTEALDPATPPNGKNPIDIVIELYLRAGLTLDEIDVATLQSERDTWLYSIVTPAYGPLFRRTLTESKDVEALVKEIRDLVMLFLWTSEGQMLTGKLFAPPLPTDVLLDVTDGGNLIAGSVQVDDQDESRLSRAVLAFGSLLGTTSDKPEDFSDVRVEIDVDDEEREFYGDVRLKEVLTQWLPTGGNSPTSAAYFTGHLIGRFRHGARLVTFRLEVKDDDSVRLGSYVRLTSSMIQDAFGNPLPSILQVTKKTPIDDGSFEIVAIETNFMNRTFFYAPDAAPDYAVATDDDKRYGYLSDDNGFVGTPKVPGYTAW